jgi:hypothetical protein
LDGGIIGVRFPGVKRHPTAANIPHLACIANGFLLMENFSRAVRVADIINAL